MLDNLEQIVDAAPEVAALSRAARQLRVLVTSRTPLRIAAEREYPLAPLALPPTTTDSPGLLTYPAVALFVDRAQRQALFELTADECRGRRRRSVGASTGCRSRSSSPPLASGSSRRKRCASGSTTRSSSSPPGHATAGAATDAARDDRLEPRPPD